MLSVSVTLKAVYGWRSGEENGEGVIREAENIGKIPRKTLPDREEKWFELYSVLFTYNKQIHFGDFCFKLFIGLVNILINKQNHSTLSSNPN